VTLRDDGVAAARRRAAQQFARRKILVVKKITEVLQCYLFFFDSHTFESLLA
jgi:hypothetical protein